MSDWRLNTPVAFIIFNRPETTERVFREIAAARPPMLLVVADGPVAGNARQSGQCAQARAIIERVDWPCQVKLNYSESNLGCRRRVSSGLDWVFEQVPEAIILEDDCVPHPTFFRYCEDLLIRYRADQRVGMISGDNFQFGRKVGTGSYYFSKYAHIWGWASWRRAWRYYDVNASLWPQFQASGDFERVAVPFEREAWRFAFEGAHSGRIDTWDYQWTLACWCQSMMVILPQVNLVSNIGFGPQATHTHAGSVYANLQSQEMQWPLLEPSFMATRADADRFTAQHMFSAPLRTRVKRWLKRVSGLQ
jgi:hypothetical protein